MSDLYTKRMEQRLLELQEKIAIMQRDLEEITIARDERITAFKITADRKKVDIEIMEGIVKYLDTQIQKR
tara:strand:- start:2620 stop:2829 length:210 start_codon:yes stop_codon:yes gene_type:complete